MLGAGIWREWRDQAGRFLFDQMVEYFLRLPAIPLFFTWRWVTGWVEDPFILYPVAYWEVVLGCVYWGLWIFAFARGAKWLSMALFAYFIVNVAMGIVSACLDDSP